MSTQVTAMICTSTRETDRNPQPLHALQLTDALLRLKTVTQPTGLSGAAVYRKLAAGEFPEPVRLGSRCTRWKAADVRVLIPTRS